MVRDDFDLLVPSQGLSRRGFGRTALGAGFAAAVMPVVAQTAIKTDAQGLVTGEVDIPVGSFKMPAYRAAPAGKTQAPVIFVISEIFGVHEYIADVARRFAKAGYFAIAPELFVRQGDAQSYGEIAKLQAEVYLLTRTAQGTVIRLPYLVGKGLAQRIKDGQPYAAGTVEVSSLEIMAMRILRCLTSSQRFHVLHGDVVDVNLLAAAIHFGGS